MIRQLADKLTCDPKKDKNCECKTHKKAGIEDNKLRYSNVRECIIKH